MRAYTRGDEIILHYDLTRYVPNRMGVGDILEVDLGEGYSAGVAVKITHVTKGDDAVDVLVRTL